ncbi:MAG: glycosyltransferase family 4 protein [Thermoanaerobaculia bacterium]
MKILQVLEFNKFNTGSVHQMFQAAVGLRERGHDVTIASRPEAELEARAKEQGICFAGFPFRNAVDFRTTLGLARLIGEIRPDVIHAHKGLAHSHALLASWRHPAGAFVVNRGVSFPLDFWNRGKYRSKRVDLIVTVCQQNKDVVVDSGKVPSEKVEVVFAGTDVELFDPAKWDPRAFRREKGIADDAYVIAQVGVRDWKGWMELIDSVSDVVPTHPNVQLALIGCKTPEDADDIRRYASQAGIATNVIPVEVRSDMPSVFASCDLVVDASWAGTGITGTIREAMAMEKPVIATDAGGNVELITTPDVGWMIPMKDRAALTRTILEVMESPRSAEIGRRARQHVINGYSKELRIDKLERLYRGILERKK